MAKYRVTVDITDAHGWQSFLVEADSQEEAIAKWESDSGEFEAEEVEVMALDHESAVAELVTDEPPTESNGEQKP